MTFNITLTKKMWGEITQGVQEMLTEATFFIKKEGIILSQLDSSKAAMVKIDIPAKEFEEYECTEQHIISVSTEMLSKIYKRLTEAKTVNIKSNNKSTVRITVNLPTKKKTFEIANFKPFQEEPQKFPELSSDAEITITKKAFKEAFDDVTIAANYVTLKVKGNKMTLNGDTGDDISNNTTELTKIEDDESSIISIDVNKEVERAQFSGEYINSMIKSISAKQLQIEVTQDKPLVVYTWLTDTAFIAFMIAPRVERRAGR